MSATLHAVLRLGLYGAAGTLVIVIGSTFFDAAVLAGSAALLLVGGVVMGAGIALYGLAYRGLLR